MHTEHPPVQRLVHEPVAGWGRLPLGMSFGGDANAVAVDSHDRVIVFNRGPVPVVVFDAEGNYLAGWGEGQYHAPHAVAIDADDNLLLVDTGGSYLGEGGHVIEKRTIEGELLMQIGTRGQCAERYSGEPFNGPTDIAVHPRTGEYFITDGYGNSRVHRFSPDGDHVASWGALGSDEGEFDVPHGIAFLDEDHVVVVDRENFRLQVFSTAGEFVEQWFAHRPGAIRAAGGLLYLAELGPVAFQWKLPNLGCRIRILDMQGADVARFGSRLPGTGPDQFIAPHGLAVDSRGDVYIAEVSKTWLGFVGDALSAGSEVVSLRKWKRSEEDAHEAGPRS
jgi:DNA-binding beta-propeller fold protein YncE